MKLRQRLANRSGQSMIEYLVIAAVVIAAIIAIQGAVRGKADSVMQKSSDAIGRGADQLDTLKVQTF